MTSEADQRGFGALARATLLIAAIAIGGGVILARVDRGETTRSSALPSIAPPRVLPGPVEPLAVPKAANRRERDSLRWTRVLNAPAAALVRGTEEVAPDDLCDVLKTLKWRTESWDTSELDPRFGECTAERTYPRKRAAGAAEIDEAGSAFAILRGSPDGPVREMRFKLNLLDPETARRTALDVAEALRAMFAELKWDLPADIVTSIETLQPVERTLQGTHLRFWREVGAAERYNLTVIAPDVPPNRPPDRLIPPKEADAKSASVRELD